MLRIGRKLIVLCLLVIFIVSGCSSKELDFDMQAVVDSLSSKDYFGTDFYEVEGSALVQMYGIEVEDVNALGYAGSGGVADELTVFSVKNESDADTILQVAQDRIAERIEAYKSYKPDEVFKLEHAFVDKYGTYIVVGVCSDDEAFKKDLEAIIYK
jgi:hypothetical protein